MKPLPVSLVGFGRQGKHHFKALEHLAQKNLVEIVGVCDVIKPTELAVPYFPNYQTMFDQAPAEIVFISTPNYLHQQISLAALEQGSHVIKEKPLAITYDQGEALISAAKKARRIVATTQQRYHSPIFQELKEALHYIGKVLSFSYIFTLNDTQKSWYWDLSQAGGGSWLNIGWHGLSVIQWVLGTIQEVKLALASGGQRPWNYETDHSALATISLTGDVSGSVFFSCVYPKEEKLLITGENGTLKMDRHTIIVSSKIAELEIKVTSSDEEIYLSQLQSLLSSVTSCRYDMYRDLAILKAIELGTNSQLKGFHES